MIEERIKLLHDFRSALERWFNDEFIPKERSELRYFINRNLIAVRNAVREAGTLKLITIGPPSAVGGLVVRDADPFENLFEEFWGISPIPVAIDSIEQAIGVYEHMQSEPGLVSLFRKEVIDIESGIERALRPAFRANRPNSEKAVQDAIENILNALGVSFVRDREVAHVGGKAFKPDFTVGELDLALEVKLATESHGVSKIQEEIAADISAYRTKWRYLIFVIYDLGVIDDPYQLRREHIKLFGVPVVIVKH
ncbi:MAG TPA: hypothetical protein DCL61_18720 [Cyanobacteria bacterium UBA12227]|nr:hypothetical protein [Cyanobacteria bacterium UBA12227]HAX89926.1 hypothetical protein [Cyanobacteria bacterium UBA11370]HBY80632.1 hypothetical protein [Cyanobacteria bacterium UBA11148]